MGQYIQVEDKVKVYVEDIGEGTPVVFIHGWPLDYTMFEYQFMQLPRQGYRCIGIDLRGFGRSDSPWEGYSYNRLADDIRAVIDELKLDHAILAGFSLGGAVAIRYMSRHAGHGIAKLLLMGAAAPSFIQRDHFPFGAPEEQIEKLMIATLADRPQMVADFSKTFTDKGGSESFEEWLQMHGVNASAQGTLRALESLRDEDLRGDLANIQVPTAIFHGERDQICSFELAKLMNRGIANSRLVVFEESGHAMLFDEPDKFSEELTGFLAASPASRSTSASDLPTTTFPSV
ncbi:Pimeloyl-ACP methyl ester carboxylesterase [Paenibacillus sp. 1_12]|uniref:alpha/beta fold hydrolase n=1 Tax=Paenibacillus sp. 1_12 TaxID=1566278 RepID=UPI0008EC25C8|nr:alpha/beta hydrolase [Paenibacillus sp. 1_12]SFL92974.1 Pimeloyl-ACP methyl ester carboxylesterase [Paenibacillus sp. 1_12]